MLSKPENLSGILNWCIEGLWLIDELGFEPPASVLAATDAYRMDSDKFSRFLEEEFVEEAGVETQTSVAYERFRIWCAKNGHQVESSKNFKAGICNCVEVRYKRPQGAPRTSNPLNLIIGYRMRFDDPQPDSRWNG